MGLAEAIAWSVLTIITVPLVFTPGFFVPIGTAGMAISAYQTWRNENVSRPSRPH